MEARPGVLARFAEVRWQLELAPLRWLGAGMLGLGTLLPALPHNPGLPCPLRSITGVPCPLCGMTTSVKSTMHGQLRTAVAANPFGLVAVAVATLLLVRPRWRRATLPALPLVLLAVLSWAWELHRFHWI